MPCRPSEGGKQRSIETSDLSSNLSSDSLKRSSVLSKRSSGSGEVSGIRKRRKRVVVKYTELRWALRGWYRGPNEEIDCDLFSWQ